MNELTKALVESELKQAIPQSGIIADYMQYVTPLTEAPYQFHLMGGLMAISTILSNHVFIPFGEKKIYPNLYVILVGASSTSRKSTSLDYSIGLISDIAEECIFPNEITPEAFKEELSNHAQGIFKVSEFGSLLAQFEKEYMRGMKEFLTDIFDCPVKYERKLRGNKFVINNPCINIFGASDVTWISDKFKEKDIRGGFLPRFIFFIGEKSDRRISLPVDNPDRTLRFKVISKLGALKNIKGKIDLSEIKAEYDTWYNAHWDELAEQNNADILAPFYSRLAIYCLKLAVLYHFSESTSLVLSKESLSKACHLVNYLKYKIAELLDTELVFGRDMQNKARVYKLIEKEPGIRRSKLLTNSHLTARDLNIVIETLTQEEKIRIDGKSYYVKEDNPVPRNTVPRFQKLSKLAKD